MNKEKRLTIKYFIQQKIAEISKFLGIASLIAFVPYFIGLLVLRINPSLLIEILGVEESGIKDIPILNEYLTGLLLIMIALAVGLGILLAIVGIKEWIKRNWEKASKRAKEELK